MADLLITSDAVISSCGLYRYRLSRIWDYRSAPLPWVMLNPSMADDRLDDPTIRRCMSFARREGAGGIEVLNLFALRSPSPKALRAAADPIGPDNDEWIREILFPHSRVVVAWGQHGSLNQRDAVVLRSLMSYGLDILALGWTSGGHPRHPLYVANDKPFELVVRR